MGGNPLPQSKRPIGNPAAPPFVPAAISLAGAIRRELETNLPKLLSLNPSRREAVAQHLDRLAGHPPAPSATGAGDGGAGLRRWIESPRTPAQNQALQIFFDEVALIALGQAILLKAWSDRGLRAWKEEDLGRLNWALSCALKPHVPLDREGWQITRPNLYSWYNPGPAIQKEIWNALGGWRITDEDPSLLAGLLRLARQAQPDWAEMRSYDSRFFGLLWETMGSFGFDSAADSGPLKRKRVVFSPTLRDGTMVRTGPASVTWIGLESHAFQLLAAELVQLWWGPAAPPVWAQGNGLEVHTRDQLSLALGSPKPSLLSRISEMEACDVAFVMEEKAVRLSGRSAEANRLREQVEQLPYFKKIRSTGTSQGDLQACVAMSKLRPGGLLWWAREEPLAAGDGQEMLGFLLERSRLICEWDLSEINHQLPVSLPPFPRYFYLFAREADIQARLSHRPSRVALHGQIRSHVEVPILLGDALHAALSAPGAYPCRGQWKIHVQVSPNTQKDWAERWPDPAAHDTIRALEELRSRSLPLATVTTVRPAPSGDPAKEGKWAVHPSLKGLWLHGTNSSRGRRLAADPLPRAGSEAKGGGALVLVSDDSWIAPLSAYLESEPVRHWLEHHAERRGDQWSLSEQAVKFIPVPNSLLRALGVPVEATERGDTAGEPSPEPGSFAVPLPGDWERLAAEIAHQPKRVLERLSSLDRRDPTSAPIRAAVFVRAARALEQLRTGQQRLFSLVADDGRIRWRELLGVLPRSECVALTLHPSIRLSGSMPPHLPIHRIERVRAPSQGILLATESGFNLHLSAENSRWIDMLWDQLEGLSHPTWNELIQYLRLPRLLDLAESTAADVLRCHGDQSNRLRDLTEVLSACSVF